MTSVLRRTNGTTAPAGQELQMEMNGDTDMWIDSTTEGFAEQILYAVPADLVLRPGTAHVQLTDSGQLDALPIQENQKERYKKEFDNYHFYLISVTADSAGNGTDTIPLRMDETNLQMNRVYQMDAWALRGSDSCDQVLKVQYIRKRLGRRVIISNKWQAPKLIESADDIDEIWFKWFFGWLMD